MRNMYFMMALLAAAVFTLPHQAEAGDRLTVHEVHSFVEDLQGALNSEDMMAARRFLSRHVSENASFENFVTRMAATPAYRQQIWHDGYGNPVYYRMPYAYYPAYRTTSLQTLGKWDQINVLERKKRSIAGYRQDLSVEDVEISAYGRTATIKLNKREYGLYYTSAAHGLTDHLLQAESTCTVKLSKPRTQVYMTRMDCNVRMKLPL